VCSPDVDAQRAHARGDLGRAPDGARRAVEGRDEAVAGRVHLPAAEPFELRPDQTVVRGEELQPFLVSHPGGQFGRPDDVREQTR
jgi:hypothetical protein